MKLHEHFLEKDLKQASIHYECAMDCLITVCDHINAGEMEMAKHRGTDMLLSLCELSKLSERKYKLDKMVELANQLLHQENGEQKMGSYFGRLLHEMDQ